MRVSLVKFWANSLKYVIIGLFFSWECWSLFGAPKLQHSQTKVLSLSVDTKQKKFKKKMNQEIIKSWNYLYSNLKKIEKMGFFFCIFLCFFRISLGVRQAFVLYDYNLILFMGVPPLVRGAQAPALPQHRNKVNLSIK